MEDNIDRNHLYGTGYAEEVHAIGERIAVSSQRIADNHHALQRRMEARLGPIRPQVNYDALSQDFAQTSTAEISTEEPKLFTEYNPTGKLDDKQYVQPSISNDETISDALMQQFWGEPSSLERYKAGFTHLPKLIGGLAVKAARTLRERLAPIFIEDQTETQQLTHVPLRLVAQPEGSTNYIERQPRRASLARAAACIAIAATLTAGAGSVNRSHAPDVSGHTYAAQAMTAPEELPDTESVVTDNFIAPSTITLAEEQISLPALATALDVPISVAPTETPTTKAASTDTDCSIKFVKEAPIERAVYSAQYLMDKHNLTPLGSSMLVGNFTQETGDLDPSTVNKAERAIGLGQWRDERQAGMPSDLPGQLTFAVDVEMPRDGRAYLADMLRDSSATEAQLERGLADWERYGHKGLRTEYGRIIHAFVQNCL